MIEFYAENPAQLGVRFTELRLRRQTLIHVPAYVDTGLPLKISQAYWKRKNLKNVLKLLDQETILLIVLLIIVIKFRKQEHFQRFIRKIS